MANKKDKQKELINICTQVKRTIKTKFSNGTITKISKTEAFDMVSKRLGLASSRTLWRNSERKSYLDNWFSKLETELEEIIDNNNYTNKSNNNIVTISSTTEKIDDIDTLINKYNEALNLIKTYEAAIKVLREENDTLRMGVVPRYGKID